MSRTSSCEHCQKRLFGILTREPRWGISRRGWLVLGSLTLATGFLFVVCIHPFLGITHRVKTDVLVVEGWVHPYAIRCAVEEFKNGSYRQAYTTGGPVLGSGGYINDFNTAASVGADLLIGAGFPKESLHKVPSRVAGRDRTYSSAIALKDWFKANQVSVQAFNILTEEAHARRTRLLFQNAFGRDAKVGVIAVPSPDYDGRHWWRYSEGVREVLGETIAYAYARICFW